MIKRIALSAFALLISLVAAHAEGEGTAVGVNPDALSRRGSAEHVLVVGSDVSVGDRIVTGPSGNVQLLFDDQTRLVVGPRSALEIETYLLNGSGADKFAVNALAGTFRFISGHSPKSAYSINTPTASIAVRGTMFDLSVASNYTVTMLYEGALSVCRGPNCVQLTKRCDIGEVNGNDTALLGWSAPSHTSLARLFPLANIQSAFEREFRIAGAQSCLAPPNSEAKQSISDNLKKEDQVCAYPFANC